MTTTTAAAPVSIAVPVVAVVAIVLAWRGSFPARLVAVAALFGACADGSAGVLRPRSPAGRDPLGLSGIFWALVVAVLLLLPGRRLAS